MKQIDGAINTWALEMNKVNGDDPNTSLTEIFGSDAVHQGSAQLPCRRRIYVPHVGSTQGHVECSLSDTEGHTCRNWRFKV